MVTVPHKMVGLERMLDYRGTQLEVLCASIYTVYTYFDLYVVLPFELFMDRKPSAKVYTRKNLDQILAQWQN